VEQRAYEASLDKLPEYRGDMLVGRGSRYIEPIPDMSDSRVLVYG
jgi:hypothetical protein